MNLTEHHTDDHVVDNLGVDNPVADSVDEAFERDAAPDQVEVRRNGHLAAVLGSVAAVVALAYLVRAVGSGSAVDWLVFLAIGAIAGAHAMAFMDAKTPLLVADRTGIRIRLGKTWQGLPWSELEEVEHAPRHTLLRDGRLVAFPLDPDSVLDGLDPLARRQAKIAERVHGAPFAVPLGVTTRVVGARAGLTASLLALAPDPDLVVEVVPDEVEWLDDEPWAAQAPRLDRRGADLIDLDSAHEIDDLTDTVERRRPTLADLDEAGSSYDDSRADDAGHDDLDDLDDLDHLDDGVAAAATAHPVAARSVSPLKMSFASVRAQVTQQVARQVTRHRGSERELVVGSTALAPDSYADSPALPEIEHLLRGDSTDSTDHTDHTGYSDFSDYGRSTGTGSESEAWAPVAEPIVGPQLARARQALGLDVERLAERTRIRPHVIAAIEVDDFEPCGGDFYARGHLRTLARVLGIDAAPLLATYDEIYADAPIDPRRVFEAELATGSDGAIRSLRGGPNWSVVVAAVMAVVLAWSIARLAMDGPDDATANTPGLSSDSAGLTSGETTLAAKVPVVLTAEGGGAKVVVRDGAGKVVFKGNLAFGQSRTVKAAPPVVVQTSDGSLTVAIAGEKAEAMGRTGKAARNTFVPKD